MTELDLTPVFVISAIFGGWALILHVILSHRIKKKILEVGKLEFDPELVKRVLRLVNINEFKRYQTAPVLRVSSKAFGMGRRMPIVGKYLS